MKDREKSSSFHSELSKIKTNSTSEHSILQKVSSVLVSDDSRLPLAKADFIPEKNWLISPSNSGQWIAADIIRAITKVKMSKWKFITFFDCKQKKIAEWKHDEIKVSLLRHLVKQTFFKKKSATKKNESLTSPKTGIGIYTATAIFIPAFLLFSGSGTAVVCFILNNTLDPGLCSGLSALSGILFVVAVMCLLLIVTNIIPGCKELIKNRRIIKNTEIKLAHTISNRMTGIGFLNDHKSNQKIIENTINNQNSFVKP